jgi:prepilin-type N-terminal cleavage/methylation domain-containing protein
MTQTSPKHRGFTMIELLVVMGIIVVIASLMVVVYTRATSVASRQSINYQFQSIAAALDAYKTEFNNYPTTTLNSEQAVPPVTNPDDNDINAEGLRGARTLCKALMGQTPQGVVTGAAPNYVFDMNQDLDHDGAEGFGFRVMSRSGVWQFDGTKNPVELKGKVYGPYLAPGKFRIANTNIATVVSDVTQGTLNLEDKAFNDTAVLLDANDRPILYYPVLNPQPNVNVPTPVPGTYKGTYIAEGPRTGAVNDPLPMYRFTDNSTLLSEADFKRLMGDTNGNGGIDPGETAAVKGKYILWSSGPDGFFGVNANDLRTTADQKVKSQKIDDVTNFEP